jgi:hypothetical protein
VAPFGAYLPLSTEQVLTRDRTDAPLRLTLAVDGGRPVHQDDLGRLELGVFLDTHLEEGRRGLTAGWGGDRYVLVEVPDGDRGLAWVVAWDDAPARDAFVAALGKNLGRLPATATLEATEVDGRAAAILRVGLPATVRVRARLAP